MRKSLAAVSLVCFTAITILAVFAFGADAKRVKVRSYYRKDGTFVKSHYRTAPDSNPYNNYSFPGNFNPNTGRYSTGNPSTYLKNYNNSTYDSMFSTRLVPKKGIHSEVDITYKPSNSERFDPQRLHNSILELLILDLALRIQTNQQQCVDCEVKKNLDTLVATAIERSKIESATALYRLYGEQTPARFLKIIKAEEREVTKAAKSKPPKQLVKQPVKEIRYGVIQDYLQSMGFERTAAKGY